MAHIISVKPFSRPGRRHAGRLIVAGLPPAHVLSRVLMRFPRRFRATLFGSFHPAACPDR